MAWANTLRRLGRHLLCDEDDARRALPEATVARLADAVRRSEQGHSGQIRVCVEGGLPLPLVWQGYSPRQRALDLFASLGVWDTEANNGVLIYLLLADRAVEVVADRGLTRLTPAPDWEAVLQPVRQHARAGQLEPGLLAAVAEVDALLRRHFPRQAAHATLGNELPDTPLLR